jgi:ABC-type Fe3+/spermidine/putrescine transport system ATPase subunit
MRLELKRIQREVGICFLFVTHDQDEAMSLGDRVAVMNHGRFEDLGEPRRVYDRPANRFVAEFLGTCNVLPLRRDSGSWRLPGGGVAQVDGLGDSAATSLGVRPEKIGLRLAEGAPGGPNTVIATITAALYLGSTTTYELQGPESLAMTAVLQSVGGGQRVTPGDRVEASWDAGDCFNLPEDGATT